MEKYITLLRGINISGKNKVLMPLLKTAYTPCGVYLYNKQNFKVRVAILSKTQQIL